MTPEIEEILDSVGWRFACSRHPIQTAKWTLTLNGTGGALSSSPQEAKKMASNVKKLFRSVWEAYSVLGLLPDQIIGSLNMGSTSWEEMKRMQHASSSVFPDRVGQTRSELGGLMAGLEATLSRLEDQGKRATRGRPRNDPAYAIARTVAEIYIVGLGALPTVGHLAGTNRPSGLYCRAVECLFATLGLNVGDPFLPCSDAVNSLTEEEIACFLLLRSEEHRQGVEVHIRKAQLPD